MEFSLEYDVYPKERRSIMAEKKIYLMIKVTVHSGMVNEFNEFWGRESLPLWKEHGAKHLFSFTTLAGGPINEIIRLFEFESISKWHEMEEFISGTEKGRELAKRLDRDFIISLEKRLLTSIYSE